MEAAIIVTVTASVPDSAVSEAGLEPVIAEMILEGPMGCKGAGRNHDGF